MNFKKATDQQHWNSLGPTIWMLKQQRTCETTMNKVCLQHAKIQWCGNLNLNFPKKTHNFPKFFYTYLKNETRTPDFGVKKLSRYLEVHKVDYWSRSNFLYEKLRTKKSLFSDCKTLALINVFVWNNFGQFNSDTVYEFQTHESFMFQFFSSNSTAIWTKTPV